MHGKYSIVPPWTLLSDWMSHRGLHGQDGLSLMIYLIVICVFLAASARKGKTGGLVALVIIGAIVFLAIRSGNTLHHHH